MKKYLITQTQLDLLANLLTDVGIPNDLKSLKPIEPLSTDTINRLWQDAVDYSDPIAGNSHIRLVRAIERHITGSDE